MDTRNSTRQTTTLPGETVYWPVSWSAVWVGALAALAVALLTSLAGVAVGAQMVGHGESITRWDRVHFGGIVWAVCSAFFSFVVGGWITGKIAGHPRPETAMQHAGITWLLAVPMLVVIAALGAGEYFGAWYAGLAGSPAWTNISPRAVDEAGYAIVRNNALGALTALILGLIGSVIGGWFASGEPMTFFSTGSQSLSTSTSVGSSKMSAPRA